MSASLTEPEPLDAPAGPPPRSAGERASRIRTFARSLDGAVFAGDRRVWLTAAGVGAVAFVVILVWCLVPRAYLKGTDSVDASNYVAPTPAGVATCVPDLQIPAGTARIRMEVSSETDLRPALGLALRIGSRTYRTVLAPTQEAATVTQPVWTIPARPATPSYTQATLCVTGSSLVDWIGTPTSEDETPAPTRGGQPLGSRLAVWYLPPAGAQRSYLSQLGSIFRRASLFRPGVVGAWTYWVIVFLLLPALALASIRCLAVAVAAPGRGEDGRGLRRAARLASWVFAIAAVNACCWALITPAWFAPDEVDHFAYTQSLVETGQGSARAMSSALMRWSTAEQVSMLGTRFFTDHQVGNLFGGSRPPWTQHDVDVWQRMAAGHPPQGNGGGYTTSAAAGPLYYVALAPAYAATRGASTFSQLTLMRMMSALIGALAALFAFLIGRELAPRRPWLGVLAALLVAFEPMYSFISGAVNDDVGVNAGAAALLYLLVRMLRRGVTIPVGLAAGMLLIALPIVKGTGYELWPVAFLVFAGAFLRHHGRRDLLGWVALGAGVLLVTELSIHLSGTFHAAAQNAGTGSSASTSVGAVTLARQHIATYVSYLWQAVLPRLPFMSPHFASGPNPGFNVFVVGGFGAFGWNDIEFPEWVYSTILVVMVATPVAALVACRREFRWVRAHWMECALMVLVPCAVIAGFEAAYFTISPSGISDFGRYAFPAIVALAILVVGALHAFGRRGMVYAGTALAVAMIALCVAGQLLMLTQNFA